MTDGKVGRVQKRRQNKLPPSSPLTTTALVLSFLPEWLLESFTAPNSDLELHTCCHTAFNSCGEEKKAHTASVFKRVYRTCVCVYGLVRLCLAWIRHRGSAGWWTRRGQRLREGRGRSNLLISLIPRPAGALSTRRKGTKDGVNS